MNEFHMLMKNPSWLDYNVGVTEIKLGYRNGDKPTAGRR